MDTVFWVWKPPDKTQDGKTGATVRYGIYIIKIWNFYNQQVKYTQPSKLKISSKSLSNPAAKHCCFAQLYGHASAVQPTVQNLYGLNFCTVRTVSVSVESV